MAPAGGDRPLCQPEVRSGQPEVRFITRPKSRTIMIIMMRAERLGKACNLKLERSRANLNRTNVDTECAQTLGDPGPQQLGPARWLRPTCL